MSSLQVHLITGDSVAQHAVDELPELLSRPDGVVWVDIATCDEPAARVLTDVFGFHPIAVRESVERNRVPKVHAYPDHVFVVLHEPAQGAGGHVHYVELDQFVGDRYLVTVHGPVNPAVDPQLALHGTATTLERIAGGRLRPSTPFELSYAIMSTMTRDMAAFVEARTVDVWTLQQQVVEGDAHDPQELLEALFRARHGLLAVRTMADLAHQMYGRIAAVARSVPADDRHLVTDVADQFDRVRAVADSEKDYLQGVIEFYRTRTDTKMMIAAERLAVIAVVTLPITALASVYGMNLIVNDRTDFLQLAIVLGIMAAMSGLLLHWARRQGWW